jgi:hypothetical protein
MFRDARALGKCLGHLKLLPNVNSTDASQQCSALHLLASAEPVWAAYAMVVPGGFCGYGRQGPRTKSVKPPTCGRTALKSGSRSDLPPSTRTPNLLVPFHRPGMCGYQVAGLSAAFDVALSELGLVDRTDPATLAIAKLIIELAKEGERDPERLCALALKHIKIRP